MNSGHFSTASTTPRSRIILLSASTVPSQPLRIAAIIVAAGRGSRAGGDVPKQYRDLGGETILRRTTKAFSLHKAINETRIVIHPDDLDLYQKSCGDLPRLGPPVHGGSTRQSSVHAGLEALALSHPPDIVLIHDAARPYVSADLIDRAIFAAWQHGAAIPGIPLVDSIARVDHSMVMEQPVDRNVLRAAQTPQSFRFDLILSAHRRADPAAAMTDDAAVARAAGHSVVFFTGHIDNMKLTTEADFQQAERRLLAQSETRTGQGYDVHAFGPGDHIWLGGVRIAHDQGIIAHSDGDVALHAITDALLGALADGDIGTHFPPSDPQWKGASSDLFVRHAVSLLKQAGGRLVHLDVTIVCEAPKVGPHREAIRHRIAEITGLAVSRISIKATTSEKMGFTGRREGIAALALATITLPLESVPF